MSDGSALLVGESWHTVEYHTKRFVTFSSASYTEAIDHVQAALEADGVTTTGWSDPTASSRRRSTATTR
ncbi:MULTISPECIES: glutamine amidotransferase [Haloarcula]|uniref:glutamine amidotransferase n=1 Tax=Haloarcula TaxID=2237 RepID=UPI0023ED9566|nr:glutamine amidotransferase [Halomicroarcula sp. XH51]